MTETIVKIDRMIADVLAGKSVQWPTSETSADYGALVIKRVLYHGIAGLLNKSDMASANWPSSVISAVHGQAIAQVMWELRHKAVVGSLLKALHDQGISPILLKGTAIAYDLYDQPAARQRGDTDLLIAAHDLGSARLVLSRLGFKAVAMDESDNPVCLQEGWYYDAGDSCIHNIDLHWSVMNCYTLKNLFTYDESLPRTRQLSRLSEYAQSFSLVDSLLFSCVHTANNMVASYYVDGVAYTDNERLIWAYDVDLYARALQPTEWDEFCVLASNKGIARICLNVFQYAELSLGTSFPETVKKSLMAAPAETKVSRYLKQSKLKRNFMNLLAIPGFKNKLRMILNKLLPSAVYMRANYKNMHHRSLLALYCLRWFEIIFTKK